MWLLFHRRAKTQVVPGGRSFVESCPECHRRARFDEVEVTESVGVFFVDVLDDKERKYRCSACGDVFDLRDQSDAPAPTSAEELRSREDQDDRREREAEVRRLLEERKQRALAEAKANRIEDELAELKKRMGR